MRVQVAFASLILALAGLGEAAKVKPEVFTAEDLLTAPRPQAAIANPEGDLALSVVDTWDSKNDKTTRVIYVLDLKKSKSSPIEIISTTPASASDFIWLSQSTFAYLNSSSLYSASIRSGKHAAVSTNVLVEFPRGTNPTNLQYEAETGLLAWSGMVWQDGDFGHVAKLDEEYEHRGDTGQVYDELYVRHWDTWRISGKVYTIGMTKLSKVSTSAEGEEVFLVSTIKGQKFLNILNGTGIYSQMDPIPEISLSKAHLAFAAKTPLLNVATHTRQEVYLLPVHSLDTDSFSSRPFQLTPGNQGSVSSLSFSPDGKKVAWLQMGKDGYESDKRVIVVHELSTERGKLGKTTRQLEAWDRSPSSIKWAQDSKSMYLLAEDKGRVLPFHFSENDTKPKPLGSNGSSTSITPLSGGKVLVSKSSITTPSDEYIISLSEGKDGKTSLSTEQITDWSSKSLDGRLDGMQGEEFWFKGAEGWKVMGWAIKPRGWKEGEKKKWPLAFLIHGGPQSAWEDAWSTRWNPALFASQGYFVIAINPTGSTGYGQEFTDRMQNQWGGRPLKDLLAGYQAALTLYPEIDPERTAALGASYGGYMINWINGHNDQFGFKTLVCHDGVFSTTETFFSTEEVYFPIQEYNGSPMSDRLAYEKWNPVNHISEWTTPQLVIHGGRDFRLGESQGIGAFTALQVQGVPSRLLYFPDENHWVLKASNSLKWHYEVFRWLDEWVGGRSDKIQQEPSSQQQVAWSTSA